MKVLIHKNGAQNYRIKFVEIKAASFGKLKERELKSFTGVLDVDFVHNPSK